TLSPAVHALGVNDRLVWSPTSWGTRSTSCSWIICTGRIGRRRGPVSPSWAARCHAVAWRRAGTALLDRPRRRTPPDAFQEPLGTHAMAASVASRAILSARMPGLGGPWDIPRPLNPIIHPPSRRLCRIPPFTLRDPEGRTSGREADGPASPPQGQA